MNVSQNPFPTIARSILAAKTSSVINVSTGTLLPDLAFSLKMSLTSEKERV